MLIVQNSKICTRSGVAPLKDEFGNFVSNDLPKAEVLNKYFSSVFAEDNSVIPDNPTLQIVTNAIDKLNSVFFLSK